MHAVNSDSDLEFSMDTPLLYKIITFDINNLRWIKILRCKLNIHNWEYSEPRAIPVEFVGDILIYETRKCNCCEKIQKTSYIYSLEMPLKWENV